MTQAFGLISFPADDAAVEDDDVEDAAVPLELFDFPSMPST